MYVEPATSNFAPGELVPIPTLPLEFIINLASEIVALEESATVFTHKQVSLGRYLLRYFQT